MAHRDGGVVTCDSCGVTCHSWGVAGPSILYIVHNFITELWYIAPSIQYTTVMYTYTTSHSCHSSIHTRAAHGPVRTPPQRHQVTTGLPQQPSTTIHHHTDHARPATNSTSNAATYTKHHNTVIKPYTTSQYTT